MYIYIYMYYQKAPNGCHRSLPPTQKAPSPRVDSALRGLLQHLLELMQRRRARQELVHVLPGARFKTGRGTRGSVEKGGKPVEVSLGGQVKYIYIYICCFYCFPGFEDGS